MAAIRVDIFSLRLLAPTAVTPFHLDCWRATLRIVPDAAASLLIDGWDAFDLFVDQGTGSPQVQVFSLGGLVVNGQPVNLNAVWTLSTGAGRIEGSIIREYWDTQLPDPQSHSGR